MKTKKRSCEKREREVRGMFSFLQSLLVVIKDSMLTGVIPNE